MTTIAFRAAKTQRFNLMYHVQYSRGESIEKLG